MNGRGNVVKIRPYDLERKKWAFDNITLVKTRAYFHPNSSQLSICNRCQKRMALSFKD